MKKSQIVLVITAALTCALLVAGVVSALDIVANDPSLAAAGGPPAGAGMDLAAASEVSVITTTTTAPAPTTTTVPPTTTTAAPTTTTTLVTFPGGLVIQPSYEVVHAAGQVRVFDSPGGTVVKTLSRTNAIGKVTTLPVVSLESFERAPGWYEVRLAQRPNGSTGWVSGSEVTAETLTHVIVIERAAHRLTLLDGGVKVGSYPVCIGTDTNPTPIGSFCALGVIEPGGVYGPYAIPTSAYSETLPDWPGGGVVGIHGTNNPDSVGKSVSHGCIRMYNKDITEVVQSVVPGTPIFIVP
jgi:lipoprotein-anchoring transpeptidase ErfK/SrfK